jgi:hypothetical protein
VIGGGAAAMLLEEQNLEFRKTKDVDLVLLTNGSKELNSRISQSNPACYFGTIVVSKPGLRLSFQIVCISTRKYFNVDFYISIKPAIEPLNHVLDQGFLGLIFVSRYIDIRAK